LLAYYGDDFTGSTDVLEALSRVGIETVLFVEPPSEDALRQYPNVRAVGIAGNSRTMSPNQMDSTLPGAFGALRSLHPKIVHYKVCSTFDSAPQIGSIGRAIDLGHRIFQNRWIPLVVGAPVLQRFCVFGNLFARSGLDSPPFRLDRHPTMRHHPTTPMAEADLRVHLSHQTDRPSELIDILSLERGRESLAARIAEIADGNVGLFDTLTDEHLATIGRVIWETQAREAKPLFVAGSSGIEYALTRHWLKEGIAAEGNQLPTAPPVDRTVVVSGSCSPVTERQIAWALAHGFVEVPIDTARVLKSKQPDADVSEITKQVLTMLEEGRSVIVHTSRGPTDERISQTKQTAAQTGTMSDRLGTLLGRVLREVLQASRLPRVAVTGGDTAGYVARTLGIEALEMAAPLAPGAPLCVARSKDAAVDGVEITFKGGQVGRDDFFGSLLSGGSFE
jgi:uncharacterized protein YgbK (DUF1537 family)